MTRSIDQSLARDIKDAAILIVDDNQSNVDLLREILKHDGYASVRGESDPRIVPALCEAQRFDLLLIDVRMPHMSGFELMGRVRAIYADDHVPILVLTAHIDQATRRTSLELGANDFLTKPFIAWELLHRVRNMLEIRMLYRGAADQNRELERRVAERTAELSAALDAARQADRAKLDFLSVMSHELRTPLNSIIGFAEVLAGDRQRRDDPGDGLEYVALIEESGKALLTMVNSILDFTRAATGGIELSEAQVDLHHMLDECLAQIDAKARAKRISVSARPASAPSLVLRADPRRLREMLMGVLDNAVKFGHPGGHVGVRTERRADGVAVVVSDDGPGIPPDIADRVFSPFTQAESALGRKHEGIGLGLPIALRLAELHGGTVDLDSAPGRGTTVTILLPASRLVTPTAPAALKEPALLE